ncbi:MAG: hypothetical protein ACRCWR_10255 [Saezia sp.]
MTCITFFDKKLFDNIRAHLTLRSKQGLEIARSADNEEQILSGLRMLFIEKLLYGKSSQEIVEKDLAEIKIIEKFYKKAKTDSDFLQKTHLALLQPLFNSLERRVAECMLFIWILQQNLENPDAIEDRAKVRDLIFEVAAQHKVEKGNPLIITALAALYGHEQAMKIVKKDAVVIKDNVVSLSNTQIEMICLLLLPEVVSAYSKRFWKEAEERQENAVVGDIQYQFLTTNTLFNDFVKSLEVVAYPMESTEGWECEFGMALTVDLFPLIQNDEKEMADLISKMT